MTPPATGTDQISADIAFDRVRALVNRLFAIVFLALAIVAIAGIGLRYAEVSREGRQSAANLAEVLSEYLVVRLGAIDGLLSKIVASSRRIGGPEGPPREWTSVLRSAMTGIPGVSAVVILDADGNVAHATIPQMAGLSWGDRPIFRQLATGHPNQLAIDLPFTMIAGDQVLVPIGRALTGSNGEFVGAAIATLVPSQLQDFYRKFDLGRDGIAWLLLSSGEVLLRQSSADTDGTASRGPPQFLSGRQISEDGFVAGPVEPGGSSYLTAYRRSEIGGVIAAVSFAERSLLARLWYDAVIVATVIVLAGAALFLAARKINSAVLDLVETGASGDDLANPS
jgi:hypothetical protein